MFLDYSGRIFDFGSLFSNVVPNEAPSEIRNATLTTSSTTPSTTPVVVPKPTTETVIFYPIYQEPIYDPNYYQIIPPYPIFYNAPLDPLQLQFDNFAPYYPVVDNIPSIYPDGIQPVPYFYPGLIDGTLDEIILPSNSVNAKPTNVKPAVPSSPSQSENLIAGEGKNEVQETSIKEAEKLLYEFYAKHLSKINAQESTESSTKTHNETTSEYKIIFEPWITAVPEESTYPVSNRTPWIVEKITDALKQNMTNKLDSSTHVVEEIKEDVVTDKTSLGNESVSNSTIQPEVIETTQSYIEVNQSGTETASQNEIDDSRKWDFNTEGEFTTDTTTDKSSPISAKDLIKWLGKNQTSTDSKLNDSITGESTTSNVKTRRFYVDSNGNECMEEVIIFKGKQYNLFTCEEKSYNGKKELGKKPADQSDVTYFTEELQTQSTAQTTTELAPQHLVTKEDLPETYD